MIDAPRPQPASFKVTASLGFADLRAALSAGWGDFCACPKYGIFFGSVFVTIGLAMGYAILERGEVSWLIPAAAGFPLLAPFTAVGLYEVSRRREAGLAMDWGSILGAVKGRGGDQIMSMGVILFVVFGFWVIIAHLVFSVFMAEAGAGAESLEFLVSPIGLGMLAAGSVIGGLIALCLFAMTVISLPMLIDRKVDFITAVIASLKAFRGNTAVLLAWAILIALLLLIAIVPALLGLIVVMPVLGHATWHLYRRAIS